MIIDTLLPTDLSNIIWREFKPYHHIHERYCSELVIHHLIGQLTKLFIHLNTFNYIDGISVELNYDYYTQKYIPLFDVCEMLNIESGPLSYMSDNDRMNSFDIIEHPIGTLINISDRIKPLLKTIHTYGMPSSVYVMINHTSQSNIKLPSQYSMVSNQLDETVYIIQNDPCNITIYKYEEDIN